MNATFKILDSNRNIYLKFLEGYNLEQLNKTPEGFSNNLIWNAGHIVVSQQALVYRLSGLETSIPAEMSDKYKTGSRPEGYTNQAEVDIIKQLLISQPEQTKHDYAQGKFREFNEYQTKLGFHLSNLKEAMEFNNYHEGLHLGIMMQIRKFL